MINISDEAKKAFLTDGVKKEVFIEFPNNDHATITNSSIIKESLSFTESICSRDEFKFGLAEASTLEFECMNVDNIKGKTIRCRLRADGKHDILLGTFIVDSCDREADMMKRKVVAYGPSFEINFEDLGFTFESNKYRFCQDYSDMLLYYTDPYLRILNNNSNQIQYTEKEIMSSWHTCYTHSVDRKQSNGKNATIRVLVNAYESKENVYDTYYDDTDENYKIPSIFDIRRSEEIKNRISKFLNDFPNIKNDFLKAINDVNATLSKKFTEDAINEISNAFDEAFLNYLYPYITYIFVDTIGDKGAWTEYVFSGIEDNFIYPNVMTLFDPENYYITGDIGIPAVLQAYIVKEGNSKYEYEYKFVIDPKIEHPSDVNSQTTINKKKYSEVTSGFAVYDIDLKSIDYADYVESWAELNALFGSYWRSNSFSFRNINELLGRYPKETLYPNESIYPQDPNGGVLFKSSYISASYNDIIVKYDRISVSYEDLSGNTQSVYIQLVDDIKNKPETISDTNICSYINNYNPDEYTTYSLGYNTLIQNGRYTIDMIYKILTTLGLELKKIQYMPADIEAQGMPWLEAGDAIGIETKDGGIVTYILRRTLNGIWFLKDNFESR